MLYFIRLFANMSTQLWNKKNYELQLMFFCCMHVFAFLFINEQYQQFPYYYSYEYHLVEQDMTDYHKYEQNSKNH